MKKINLQMLFYGLLLFSLGTMNGILIGQIKRIADAIFPLLYFIILACAIALIWFDRRDKKKISQLKNQ